MNTGELAGLNLPDDLAAIATLSAPDEDAIKATKKEDLLVIAENFAKLWRDLIFEKVRIPDDAEVDCCLPCGAQKVLKGDELFARLLLSLGGYYSTAVRYLVDSGVFPLGQPCPGEKESFQLMRSHNIGEWPVERIWSAALLRSYYIGLGSVRYMRVLPMQPEHLTARFEPLVHRAVRYLVDDIDLARYGYQRKLAYLLATDLLGQLELYYTAKCDSTLGNHSLDPNSPFAMIKLTELPELASRDPKLLQRYGERRAEMMFEQQLSLFLQSLGFYVVPARTGESVVDMICISRDQLYPCTVLVEAKSSARPYALPTRDARALRDYVDNTRRSLATLPPIRLLLIVSGTPAKTLARKLQSLESEVSLPVRFCPAHAILRLRLGMPGSAPMDSLIRTVLEGHHVLDTETLSRVANTYSRQQEAHSMLVKTMMSKQICMPREGQRWEDG